MLFSCLSSKRVNVLSPVVPSCSPPQPQQKGEEMNEIEKEELHLLALRRALVIVCERKSNSQKQPRKGLFRHFFSRSRKEFGDEFGDEELVKEEIVRVEKVLQQLKNELKNYPEISCEVEKRNINTESIDVKYSSIQMIQNSPNERTPSIPHLIPCDQIQERIIPGTGHCMYESIAVANGWSDHSLLRIITSEHLKAHADEFLGDTGLTWRNIVESENPGLDFESAVAGISKLQYGGDTEMLALEAVLGIKIAVYIPSQEGFRLVRDPMRNQAEQPLTSLVFRQAKHESGNHYNVLLAH